MTGPKIRRAHRAPQAPRYWGPDGRGSARMTTPRKRKVPEDLLVGRFDDAKTGEVWIAFTSRDGVTHWEGTDEQAALEWLAAQGLHELRNDVIRDWGDTAAAVANRRTSLGLPAIARQRRS